MNMSIPDQITHVYTADFVESVKCLQTIAIELQKIFTGKNIEKKGGG